MKFLFGFLLALAVVAAVVVATEEDLVVILTKDNFDNVIFENKLVLVDFFAPWCGHCKRLAPEFEKAAQALQGSAVLASVDCTIEEGLAQRFGIQGFPTIKLFKNGELSLDFDGERTAAGIQEWMRKRSEPTVVAIEDRAAFDKFNERVNLARVVYFADAGTDFTFFKTVADGPAGAEFGFGSVSNTELAEELKQKMGSIVFFYEHQSPVVYTGELNVEALTEFLETQALPHLETLVLNQAFINRVTTAARPMAMAFHENAEGVEFFRSLAGKVEGVHFTETAVSAYPELAAQWGASGTKFPTFIMATWDEGRPNFKAWNEETELTEEAAVAWINECLSGSCTGYRKSQPIPEKDEGAVKTLVYKNFDEIVMDSSKDVLVEFYAPWCGHCKALAPLYEDVASMFVPIKTHVIAKIDATANHVDEALGIEGFPTLLLFKADDKTNPLKYAGTRDVPSISKWLAESGTHPVDMSDLAPVGDADENLEVLLNANDDHAHDEL